LPVPEKIDFYINLAKEKEIKKIETKKKAEEKKQKAEAKKKAEEKQKELKLLKKLQTKYAPSPDYPLDWNGLREN